MCARAEREYCMLTAFDNILRLKCKVRTVVFEHMFDFTNVSARDIEAIFIAKARIIFQDKTAAAAEAAGMSVEDYLAKTYVDDSAIDMSKFCAEYGLQLVRESGLSTFEKTLKAVKSGKYTPEQLTALKQALATM